MGRLEGRGVFAHSFAMVPFVPLAIQDSINDSNRTLGRVDPLALQFIGLSLPEATPTAAPQLLRPLPEFH